MWPPRWVRSPRTEQLPSLLITSAPVQVAVGADIELTVSTRNLVRDRFLGAAVGGYYLESSLLDDEGLQRGHFHTACRILGATDVAPDSSPAPAFFLATQDNGGGVGPGLGEDHRARIGQRRGRHHAVQLVGR